MSKKGRQNCTFSGSLAEAADEYLPHGFNRRYDPGVSLAQR
jgi:hypothetical protein